MRWPGRYEVRGLVGRRVEPLHRYGRERDAEQVARVLFRDGHSLRDGAKYTGVAVFDRAYRINLFEKSAPKRRYG